MALFVKSLTNAHIAVAKHPGLAWDSAISQPRTCVVDFRSTCCNLLRRKLLRFFTNPHVLFRLLLLVFGRAGYSNLGLSPSFRQPVPFRPHFFLNFSRSPASFRGTSVLLFPREGLPVSGYVLAIGFPVATEVDFSWINRYSSRKPARNGDPQ